jgi:hypothetical protein
MGGEKVNKKQAVVEFKEYWLPVIKEEYEQDGVPDYPARSEAWNNYTDMLCKDGQITDWQYTNWKLPECCLRPEER